MNAECLWHEESKDLIPHI